MAAPSVPSEVEAKLIVPEERDLRGMGRIERIGAYRLQPRDTVRLYTVYVDTADFAVARAGAAIRLRRARGKWEASAKWGGEVRRGIHERAELNVPLARRPRMPFVLPDGPLRTYLTALVAGRELQPVLVTDIRRRRIDVFRIDAPGEPSVAELALDRVRVSQASAGVAVQMYFEAEIEQTNGSRADIRALARLLSQRFSAIPASDSKFTRGMRLVYGSAAVPVAAHRLAPEDSLSDAVRTIVGRHLRRIRLTDPGTRLGADPEALHDLRVAVRRLRALVRAFPAAFPARTLRYLEVELPWLGGALGKVRDLDVQIARLERHSASTPAGHRRGFSGYGQYLQEQRAAQRAGMLETLDSVRYFGLLVELEKFATPRAHVRRSAAGEGAHEALAASGRRAAKDAFRRLRKRGEEVRSAPTPEDLHALRIRAKRLRYVLEFISDISGKPGSRLVRRVARLQDLLGGYHDNMVTADTVRAYVESHTGDQPPAAMLALATLVGQHLHAAEMQRVQFDRAWSEFLRPRTRRVFRDLLWRLKDAVHVAPPEAAADSAAPATEAGSVEAVGSETSPGAAQEAAPPPESGEPGSGGSEPQ